MQTVVVAVLAVVAGIGGAAAGCHPTGAPVLDAAYTFVLAGLVTVCSASAARGAVLALAVAATALGQGWIWIPAGTSVILAFSAVLPRRHIPWLGALAGGLAVQAVLRWPERMFHGSTALTAGAVIAVVIGSAWLRLERRRRRWAAALFAGLIAVAAAMTATFLMAGLGARSAFEQGARNARTALSEVEGSDPSSATVQLRLATAQLDAAERRADPWWAAGASLVPVVAEQRSAVLRTARAGTKLLALAAADSRSLDFHQLAVRGGRLDLQAVEALAAPLGALDRQLATSEAQIEAARSQWLVSPLASPLDQLSSQLSRAHRTVHLAAEAARAVPPLLGAGGPRSYFVAFMSPAETRGLDGVIAAYAVITADQGRITITRSGPIDELLGHAQPRITGPADYLRRYGPFQPQQYLQDLGYSPDFPSVADVIRQVYPQVGGQPIDGVLAMDPYALAALLQFTGPLDVPGMEAPLTSSDAAQVLMRDQYLDVPASIGQSGRHDLLQEALSVGFHKLLSVPFPAPRQLGEALAPVVRQGRLMFWSFHPAEQGLLESIGLSGAFPRPGRSSDVLAFTAANAGANKIDSYLDERIADHVAYDPTTGHVSATVRITLTNNAPPAGLPSYVIGSYRGSGLPPGTNSMWMSLYTPLRLTQATVGGHPLDLGRGTPELGMVAYSGYVNIPARSTVTVTASLEGWVDPGPDYRMTLRVEPFAHPAATTVEVTRAGRTGSSPDPIAWSPGPAEVASHTWVLGSGSA